MRACFRHGMEAACVLVIVILSLIVGPFVWTYRAAARACAWVREVLASRRRMRLWRRIQHDGLRQFFIDRERSRMREQPADPRACKPPFHRR